MHTPRLPLAMAGLAAGCLASTPAHAGGFYIQEQSATEAGRAYSGDAAAGDSAATVFFNPAAMTELEGINVEIGGQMLFVTATQENQGTTRTIPGMPVIVPVAGGNGGSPFAQPLLVPSGYVTARVNERLWLGLGVNSPFGVALDYDPDFFGRYDSLSSDLFTLNVSPSFAYKLSDTVSVGGGIDIQHIDVDLKSAVPNLSPLDPDAALRIKGKDTSIGWNAGLTVNLAPVRLGAHYRSGINHHVKGSFELSGLTGPLAAFNISTPATAPLALPGIATVSAVFGTDRPWRVFGTWRWYNWSKFNEIRVEPEGLPPQINQQDYKDSWSMALGGEYDLGDKLTIRGGTMFDQSPITDEHRSTRVPDGDRIWLTGGLTYRLSQRFTANLAYAHVFVKDEAIDRTDAFFEGTPAALAVTTRANSGGNADVVALSLGARF